MIKIEHIRRHATARPEATAVVDGDVRLSWVELADAVERCAAGLTARLPEGRPARPVRAVFLAGPRWELAVAMAACATLGIPCTGIDPAQGAGRLARTLALLDPRVVFASGEHASALDGTEWSGAREVLRIALDHEDSPDPGVPPRHEGAEGAGGAGGERGTEKVRGAEDGAGVRDLAGAGVGAGDGGRFGLERARFYDLLMSEPLRRLPEPLHRESLAVVPGGPRPRVTVRGTAAEGRALLDLVDEFGFDAYDTHLVAAPLWQPLSLQLARTLLTVGAGVVLDATGDAEVLAALVTAERVTTAVIEPGALGRLLVHPDSGPLARTGRLRCVITPGRHLGRWTVDTAWKRLGPVLHLAHITPEAGLGALLTPEESLVTRMRTGRAVLGTTVAVLDGTGAVLPAGRPGRLAFAGPQVMDGYLDADADADAGVDPDGDAEGGGRSEHGPAEGEFVTLDTGAGERRFLVTGDLGVLDERGRVTLTGRAGGVTAPVRDLAVDAALFRLESDLLNLPCLRDTAVVRVSLPTLGDALVVPFIAVAVGREATGYTALRTACARRVPSIPAHVIAVDHIPYSPTGRIETAELLRAVVPILTLNLQLEQTVHQEISA
ncbi:class I adenylate-forming enzyme family protein [Streptomyces ziwulingensis]|uniref:AMP-dependent synthetase/ligase domain-containing protein n=1 Tax=Streptomyces ziwulingensis TaxID=1045501 RepID=A0ABP9BY69_9ACTN